MELNFLSLLGRLCLALFAGGAIGYGRSRKKREAGICTYMLISVGAALTTLLALYEYQMLMTKWANIVEIVGLRFDAARYGARVLGGIGFVGAGTILSDSHFRARGLSTATGLFASAAMGLAAGIGFYSAVVISLILIVVAMECLHPLEHAFKRRIGNLTLCVEFDEIEEISGILDFIRERCRHIYDIDLEQVGDEKDGLPLVTVSMQLKKKGVSRTEMLSSLADLQGVCSVQELIS